MFKTRKTPKGQEVRFSQFLPEGWKFSSHEEIDKQRAIRIGGESKMACDRKKKTIIYDDLEKDAGLLALLHEIGHAHQKERPDVLGEYTHNEDPEVRYKNRDLTEADIRQRGEDSKDYTWITVYDGFGKGTGGIDNDEPWFEMLVPKKIIKEYGKSQAKEERDAWAFALRQLKNFKEKDIILEENLKDLKEIESEIYSCLKSYEEVFKGQYRSGDEYFTKGRKFVEKKVDNFISKI